MAITTLSSCSALFHSHLSAQGREGESTHVPGFWSEHCVHIPEHGTGMSTPVLMPEATFVEDVAPTAANQDSFMGECRNIFYSQGGAASIKTRGGNLLSHCAFRQGTLKSIVCLQHAIKRELLAFSVTSTSPRILASLFFPSKQEGYSILIL